MSRRSTNLLKTALSALHYTGADGLLSPLTGNVGAILMLHQVLPGEPSAFSPNRILRVTPDFVDQTIRYVLESGFDIVSLDDMAIRMTEGTHRRPFVCITLDDAYRDNLVHAYPVFKRYGVPFTIYAPTDYLDGKGELWWLGLEEALRHRDRVDVRLDGALQSFSLATDAEKANAFHRIYWPLRRMDERQARAIVRDLCADAGVDLAAMCRDQIMTWDELRSLADDPLVTIGAHTRSHFAVAKLSDAEARAEMLEGIVRLERELGRRIKHFSYPFGDEASAGVRDFAIARELGLTSAVTTGKGLIRPDHINAMHALPRLSLNGDYQETRYLKVLLSGVPFMFWDWARRLTLRPVASRA